MTNLMRPFLVTCILGRLLRMVTADITKFRGLEGLSHGQDGYLQGFLLVWSQGSNLIDLSPVSKGRCEGLQTCLEPSTGEDAEHLTNNACAFWWLCKHGDKRKLCQLVEICNKAGIAQQMKWLYIYVYLLLLLHFNWLPYQPLNSTVLFVNTEVSFVQNDDYSMTFVTFSIFHDSSNSTTFP